MGEMLFNGEEIQAAARDEIELLLKFLEAWAGRMPFDSQLDVIEGKLVLICTLNVQRNPAWCRSFEDTLTAVDIEMAKRFPLLQVEVHGRYKPVNI